MTVYAFVECISLHYLFNNVQGQGRNHGIDIGGVQMLALPQIFFLSAFPTIHNFHILIKICSSRTEVFNPAPGDPLSWIVYFQPASAHLPAIFKQS